MKKEWLKDWHKEVGKEINLKGNTSTSKSIVVALGFSECDKKMKKGFQPVLFVYLIQNYGGLRGFRLTKEKYSAFPHEQEYLLMEGLNVKVLKIQEDVKIQNNHSDLQNFNGKSVTVL